MHQVGRLVKAISLLQLTGSLSQDRDESKIFARVRVDKGYGLEFVAGYENIKGWRDMSVLRSLVFTNATPCSNTECNTMFQLAESILTVNCEPVADQYGIYGFFPRGLNRVRDDRTTLTQDDHTPQLTSLRLQN